MVNTTKLRLPYMKGISFIGSCSNPQCIKADGTYWNLVGLPNSTNNPFWENYFGDNPVESEVVRLR